MQIKATRQDHNPHGGQRVNCALIAFQHAQWRNLNFLSGTRRAIASAIAIRNRAQQEQADAESAAN